MSAPRYRSVCSWKGSRSNPIVLDDGDDLIPHSPEAQLLQDHVSSDARSSVRHRQPETETFDLEEAKCLDYMKQLEDSAYGGSSTRSGSTTSLSPVTHPANNRVTSSWLEKQTTKSVSDFHRLERPQEKDWLYWTEDDFKSRNHMTRASAKARSPKVQPAQKSNGGNTPAQFLDALHNPGDARSADILKSYEEGMRHGPRVREPREPSPPPQKDITTPAPANCSDTGRTNIPKYGLASHLFASRLDYAWDDKVDVSSSTTIMQPLLPEMTSSSNKRQRDYEDYEDSDEESGSDGFDSDESYREEFIPHLAKRRRRNDKPSGSYRSIQSYRRF
ncbi:hypothetical protein F4810DRAFT_716440 [Camillea tinctor]|nr:hypothetical protein F4810DRAFT_716440 [Camillea tinctor]